MSGGYDKGFGGTGAGDHTARRRAVGQPGRGHAHEQASTGGQSHQSHWHGAASGAGATASGGTGATRQSRAHATLTGGHVASLALPRPRRRWSSYAGRFGWICAGIGGAFGLLSLAITGNALAAPVLAVLMGLGGAITFWIVATVLDVFRRV